MRVRVVAGCNASSKVIVINTQRTRMPRPPVPPAVRGTTRKTPNFMKYPYPETKRILAHLGTLLGVKEVSKRCIANLLNYRAVRPRARLPRGPSAAVLVPLFVGRSGDLYVLLSRRSDALKAFSGDTALPGGKIDVQDVTIEDTARREAFEEVGLPRDEERVPLLCVMEPHLAKGEILVTPVVVLILDNGLEPNLNSSEVTSIFAQPLVSFLSSAPHFSSGRTADPGGAYHTFTDLAWNSGTVRLHRFLTGREAEGIKPVFGLTAAILIKTATIGYGRPPEFEVQPPNAPTYLQQIAHALLTPANPVRLACEREGIDASKAAARLLCSPMATRTTEWKMIGMKWKKLVGGDNTGRVGAAVDPGKGAGSSSSPAPRDRNPGSEDLQERIDEIKSRDQDQVDGWDGECMGGLGAKIEEFKKLRLAREREERTEENGEGRGKERKDTVPDMAKFGTFLDETRDVVNQRTKEVKGNEKKLAKARKIMERQLDEVPNEDEKSDPEALFAMIPKQGQEGLEGGVETCKEGIKRGKDDIHDSERIDRGVEREKEGMGRGLEEKRELIGKGGVGHNPEQTSRRKRDAKL